MHKITLTLVLVVVFAVSDQVFAQVISDDEKMVSVNGQLLREQDSSAIFGTVLYEKMPHYDDMGVSGAGENGKFNLYLEAGSIYNFRVNKSGYVPYENSFKIEDGMDLTLYVREDLVDLIQLRNLVFDTNSDRINPSSFAELDSIASWMNANPPITIRLEGHTDYGGNEAAALELSQARVEAVKGYLEKQGRVKKNRIFTKAFGGSQPIYVGEDRDKRTVNRRVEVIILTR